MEACFLRIIYRLLCEVCLFRLLLTLDIQIARKLRFDNIFCCFYVVVLRFDAILTD